MSEEMSEEYTKMDEKYRQDDKWVDLKDVLEGLSKEQKEALIETMVSQGTPVPFKPEEERGYEIHVESQLAPACEPARDNYLSKDKRWKYFRRGTMALNGVNAIICSVAVAASLIDGNHDTAMFYGTLDALNLIPLGMNVYLEKNRIDDAEQLANLADKYR